MAQKIVCYGDLVTFEWGQKSGYLGSQSEYQASNSLYTSLKLSTHQFELITLHRADGSVNQNFDEEILSGCIFKVITDDGKDFDGVPVKYGSEVNLRLRRSGHRMHTTAEGQDGIDYGGQKTFGFKLNPKYKFNAERQYVLYGDLIIFTEKTGKNLFVEEARNAPCKVSFASNHRSTPFRINFFGVESKADERDVKTLMFSDIVQLFHNEVGGFMSAERHSAPEGKGPVSNASAGRDPLSHDKVSAQGIVGQIKKKSSRRCEASTLWQIESSVSHDKEVPVGKLKSTSQLRLRHVLTDTYLNVYFKGQKDATKKTTAAAAASSGPAGAMTFTGSQEVVLDLSSDPLESTLFNCDVLPHGSLESISSTLGKSHSVVELETNCNIRLVSHQTLAVVVAKEDTRDDQTVSDVAPLHADLFNFDGDIFRISAVPEQIVQDIFILKVFSRALSKQLMEMEKAPGNNETISRAVHLLHKLMQKDQGGVLLDRNVESDMNLVNSRQQSAIDIGFVSLLLRIANTVGSLSDARPRFLDFEVDLIRTTYQALDRLVSGNFDAVKAVVEMKGIRQMITHLGYFGQRGVIPPIAECFTVILNQTEETPKIHFIEKHDIKMLFDQVYESLIKKEVPLVAQYDMMCLLCTSTETPERPGKNPYADEQRQIRSWVCEMLLGKFYAGFSSQNRVEDFEPRHSIMVYPTQLNTKGEVLVTTTIFGQQRPTYFPTAGTVEIFEPQRPEEFDSIYQNPNDWRELISEYRKTIDAGVNTMNLSDNHGENPHVAALHGFVEWKRIFDLTEQEFSFYKTTLRLISSLCQGRNFPCQSRVRKLIPVDHILYVMESGEKTTAPVVTHHKKSQIALKFVSMFYSAGNGTARGQQADTGSPVEKVTEEDIEKECELNSLRSIFYSILCTCYLNSAILPPINDSLKTGQVKAEKTHVETWENLFLDECYNKVFSLMSQEDIEFVEISKSMAAVELLVVFAHCVYFLNTPFASDYRYTQPPATLTALIESQKTPVNRLHPPVAKSVLEAQSSFASMLPPLSGLTEEVLWDRISRMNATTIDELFKFLLQHRQERKKHVSRRGFASLVQRARLRKFMIDWTERDAVTTWRTKISEPVHRLHLAYAGCKGIAPTNEKMLSTQIDYFLSMLNILKDTLLRDFYDCDYNENPAYVDGTDEKPFYDMELHRHELIKHDCEFENWQVGTTDGVSTRSATVLVKRGTISSGSPPIKLIAERMVEMLSISSHSPDAQTQLHEERIAMKYFSREFGVPVMKESADKDGHKKKAGGEKLESNIYFERCSTIRILCSEILVMCLENSHQYGLELLWSSFSSEFSTLSRSSGSFQVIEPAAASLEELEIDLFAEETHTNSVALVSKTKGNNHSANKYEHLPGGSEIEIPEDTKQKFKQATALRVSQRLAMYPHFCFILPSFLAIMYEKMRDMLNLLHYKSDSLSYLILQLFYLIGNRRAHLAENIRSMFSDPTLRLFEEHRYLLRQRTLLSIVLEKFEASGFSSTAESSLSVRSFVHTYRNIVFNTDRSLCGVGLIHFCTGVRLENGFSNTFGNGNDRSKTVRDALHSSLAGIKKANAEADTGVVEVPVGKGDTHKMLVLKRHTTVSKVTTKYEIVVEESLDDVRMGLDLLKFPMNRLRQKILRQYQFHEMIMGFFRTQAHNIIAEAEQRSNIPSIALLSQDLNTVFALNVIFLRAFCHENAANTEAMSSRSNIALLLSLRNCHAEVVNLLCDIFHSRQDQADELLTEHNVNDLTKDVFVGLAHNNPSRNKKSSNAILLLEAILASNTSGRIYDVIIQHFNSMIYGEKLKVMLANLAGAPWDGHQLSGYSHAQLISQICDAFNRETGLPAMIRDNPFSLSTHHEQEVFNAFRGEMNNWKFLTTGSYLQVQLRLVACMATLARKSTTILQYCRTFFGSAVTLLNFLNIDKFELRGPYLVLFHSVWVSFGSPSVIQGDAEEYQKSFEVLFCWLVRDIRKYLYFSQISDSLEHTALKYFTSLEDYIITALVPFIQKFLGSTAFAGSKDAATQLKQGSLLLSIPLRMKLSTAAFEALHIVYQNMAIIINTDSIARKSPRLYHAVTTCMKTLAAIPHQPMSPVLVRLFPDVLDMNALTASVLQRAHSGENQRVGTSSRMGDHQSEEVLHQCIDMFVPTAIQMFEDASVGTFHRTEKDFRKLTERTPEFEEEIADPKKSLTFKFCTDEISRILYRHEANKTSNRFRASSSQYNFDAAKYLAPLEDPKNNFRLFVQHPIGKRGSPEWKYYNFLSRWSAHGARLVERVFHLINNSIETGTFGPSRVLLECNMYWVDVFTDGILHDNLGDMTIEEMNKDESIKDAESERLQFAQCAVLNFGGAHCVMTMMRTWKYLIPHSSDSIVEVHDKAELADQILTKGIELGIALMQYGNEEVQNNLTDIAVGIINSIGTMEQKSHFLMTVGEAIQRFRKQLSKSAAPMSDEVISKLNHMLRFLTLFTEGHNNKTQNFVRFQGDLVCMDLVSEVCNLVEDLSKAVTDVFKATYYPEDELAPKHQPSIFGRQFQAINWSRPRSDKKSLFHSETGPEMKRLCSMLNEAILTLCEFCQGPCVENQKAVARSRALKYFDELFRFFGSFQFCERVSHLDDPLEALPSASDGAFGQYLYFGSDSKVETELQWSNRFLNSYQKVITFEEVYDNLHTPVWCGYDPLSVMPLVTRQNKTGFIPENSQHWGGGFFSKSIYSSASSQVAPRSDDSAFKIWNDAMHRFYQAKKAYIAWKTSPSSNSTSIIPLAILTNEYYQIFELAEGLATLEKSCIGLINSVLEGADQASAELPQMLLRNLKVSMLIGNMANYWNRYLYLLRHSKAKVSSTSAYCYEANGAFAYYGLVMRFKDLNVSEELDNKLTNWVKKSGIKVDEHVARIEVLGKIKDSVEVVYFPIPSVVRKFWHFDLISDERQLILFPENDASRDTIEEKVIDFLKRGEDLKSILHHYQFMDELTGRNAWFAIMAFIARFSNLWITLQFYNAMGLNVMLFLYYERFHEDFFFTPFTTKDQRFAYFVMARSMVAVTGMALVSNLLLQGWLAVEIGFSDNPENEFKFNRQRNIFLYMLCQTMYASLVGRCIVANVETSPGGDVTVNLSTAVMALYYYFTNSSTMYAWLLLGLSLMGLLLNPIFFVGCMMEMLRVSALMRYVTRSFTENVDQVLAAVALGGVIIYVFVALNLVSPQMDHNFDGYEGCNSLNSCTRLHFDYGIMNSPGFSDTGSIKNVWVELFNFGYVFIVNIVLPGIVSGIIIDTFSELRSKKMNIYMDVVGNCFICGIGREQFEAESVDFTDHTQHDHNMWKYLWYQEYLRDKEVSEFTGGEQFVAEMLKNADTKYKWLPLKKARALQKVADRYDMFSLYKKVESLTERVVKMDDDLQAQFAALQSAARGKGEEDDDVE